MVIDSLKTLYRYRDLLIMWTLREIKVRYKQSVLGAAWAVLQPVALMLTFTLLFSVFAQVPSEGVPYPIFSYTALVAWTFFSTSLTFAIPSLVNSLNLVTKVYFPREILPLASVGAAFVDFAVASVVFVALLLWYQVPPSWALLWVPFLILLQVVLVLGVVLPSAAINVFYRDVRFIVPVALQLWLYATPIIYPIQMVPSALRPLYALNPMVGIVDSYRRVILHGQMPELGYLSISAVVSVFLFAVGYLYFKHAEGVFADVI